MSRGWVSVRAFLNLHSKREAGAVLVMALLIVAVVAGLSIKFAGDYQLGLTRAESRWHGTQARAYMLGMEDAALELLKEADQDPEVDYLGEGWDTEVPFEIDGGWLLARAVDASSLIDLNSLTGNNFGERPLTDPERYTEPQRRFIRLLQTFPDLPIQLEEACQIVEAIVDWTDPDDNESGFGGAESYYYQGLEMPYNAANGSFRSVDELRLVRYMTPELMTLLRPYITVLQSTTAPGGQQQGGQQQGGSSSTINVNTMPPHLLRTLNNKTVLAPLGELEAEQLAQAIPTDGFYPTVEEFKSSWETAIGNGELDVTGLAVKTEFFWLYIQVDLVEQRRGMRSLIQRDGQNFKVVLRNDTY